MPAPHDKILVIAQEWTAKGDYILLFPIAKSRQKRRKMLPDNAL
jgi:hypothetical protein